MKAKLNPLTAGIVLTMTLTLFAAPNATGAGTMGGTYNNNGNAAGGLGTVFKVTPGGALTMLVSFNGTNGLGPRGALVQGSDGNFYGTTLLGGTNLDNNGNGMGTVFKITTNGLLTTLHSFNGTGGQRPAADLVQGHDGAFYGTTELGGPDFNGYYDSGKGTVFKVTSNGVFTTLFNFDGVNGMFPIGELVQGSDGSFYGTAYGGGASGKGTVFKITTNGVLATLYSFSGADGLGPGAGLVQGRDGNFYGSTEAGGANGNCRWGLSCGTIFKITTDGTLTTLFSFDGTDGFAPQAALVQGRDGSFYGTTFFANSHNIGDGGTIFQITPDGVFTTLFHLDPANGSSPNALVQGSDGNFYGTTRDGGVGYDGTNENTGWGTIFRLVPTPPPAITAITPSSGTVMLTWASLANAVYRVQFKPSLAATDWLDLAPDVTATGSISSFADNVGDATERYYRIVLRP